MISYGYRLEKNWKKAVDLGIDVGKNTAKFNQQRAREIEKAAYKKSKEKGVALSDEAYRKIDEMYERVDKFSEGMSYLDHKYHNRHNKD